MRLWCSIPGLAVSCGVGCRCGSDSVLLWLWRKPVARAPIGPLAWEPPYAAGVAQEMAKRQKKKKVLLYLWVPRIGGGKSMEKCIFKHFEELNTSNLTSKLATTVFTSRDCKKCLWCFESRLGHSAWFGTPKAVLCKSNLD